MVRGAMGLVRWQWHLSPQSTNCSRAFVRQNSLTFKSACFWQLTKVVHWRVLFLLSSEIQRTEPKLPPQFWHYGIHRKVNSCSGCCNQHPFVAVNMRSSDLYFAFFYLRENKVINNIKGPKYLFCLPHTTTYPRKPLATLFLDVTLSQKQAHIDRVVKKSDTGFFASHLVWPLRQVLPFLASP